MTSRVLPLILVFLSPPLDAGGSLLAGAGRLLSRESFRSAGNAAEEAFVLAERTANQALMARALRLSANALDGMGDRQQASARRSRALAVARELGDRGLEAGILADAGLGHYQRAEYAAAERNLRMALALHAEVGDRSGEAAAQLALARIPYKQGRYEEALAGFQTVLAAQVKAGDRGGQAETLLAIAMLRAELRLFREALADAQQAFSIQEALGDPAGRVDALCKIAVIFLFQDAPGEAMERLEIALAIADSERDRSLRAKVLHHAAGAHQQAGRHQEAIEAYDEAILSMEQEGNLREAAWVIVRRGNSLSALDRLDEAEASYVRALGIWEQILERRPLAYHYYSLGKLQERRGNDGAALRSLRRALEAEAAVRLPYVSLVLSDMALLVQRQGDELQGLALAERAVKAAEETGNPEMRWSAYHALGRLHRHAGRRQRALGALRASLAIIESMRDEVAPSDEARAGFMETKQDAYADTVSVLFDLGRFEEALETAERARARAFLDLLSSRGSPAPTGQGRSEVLLRRGAADAGGTDRASSSTVAPAGLAELRREAARFETTIVVYFAADDDLFTWVAEPGGPIHSVRTHIGRAQLEGRLVELEAALERGPFTAAGTGGASRELEELLRQLHRELIGPVVRWLPPDARSLVTIVPHGPLFKLSFGSLIDPQGRHVAETHTLHYTPAVDVLRYTEARTLRAKDSGGVRLLAVGGPAMRQDTPGAGRLAELPASAKEVRRIAASWPAGRATLLTGREASESAVRELAPGHGVIHLASHALVFDQKPLESFVALSKGAADIPADDGTLTVSEVFDLDLRADLVTLSACGTGRGRITGDGVLGLSRAFIYAGASSVVVSLWRVADVVAQFQMERFYGALVQGADKSSALRQAQLDTLYALRRGEVVTPDGRTLLPTPALWAPFILVGEPR